jgi:hypothetical protein
MSDVPTAFEGELMLAGWKETHTGGATVTFFLPDAAALDVFRSMTVRKGGIAGQRFIAALVELGPDEKPVIQPGKGAALAQLAGRLCSDASFCSWLARTFPTDWQAAVRAQPKANTAECAGETIRFLCGVKSRAELDHDTAAAAIFHDVIRKPWAATQEGAR